MALDPNLRLKLRDTIVSEFKTIPAFETWIGLHITDENVANIVRQNVLFDERVFDFLQWITAKSRETEVLQKLADNPPNGSSVLPNVIYAATHGEVEPAVNARTGIKPIDPHDDWFVTQRPFANRKKLRDVLKVFDQAQPGADSVLVIDGERFTGKSFSIRFAVKCAPQDRFVIVDIADWGDTPMNAKDLARAIGGSKGRARPSEDFPSFDLTKEDEAVPRLLMWVTETLMGTKSWVIIDHCNRPILTRAAGALLAKLAGKIESGFLPGVKLILADIDRTKLPGALPHGSRYDRAALPDETAVRHWCESFATHLNKTVTAVQLSDFVDEVFAGITVLAGAQPGMQPAMQPVAAAALQEEEQLTPDQAALILEQRLSKISSDIQAL
jgi:hypothetical protein